MNPGMSTSTRHRRPAAKRIEIESLETRRLLAAFETPWPQPRSLTISFPADGTAIGDHSNDIRQTLDAVADRSDWQELALRAFQTWAIHADINVGLRNDHDNDFGAAGLSVSDPRFGDFRIGAFPQVGVLANSIPFQTNAGTYSGDILLNSSEPLNYHDWAGGYGPDPITVASGQRDLFSLLLHESGNSLGLADSSLDWTVMFRQYTVPKGVLSQEDIDSIQALYGARTDPYEQVSNDQLQVATLVPTPVGFQPDSEYIRVSGSLKNASDVDHYEVHPVAGQTEVTIRLKAAGISLVKSQIEVLDAAGSVLAQASADSVFANDNTIQLGDLQNHSVLYVRVTAADSGVYSVGDYQLEVDYRSAAVQASDPVAGGYDSGVDSLLTNFALADTEAGDNDTVASAGDLTMADGFAPQTRYEIVSAVSSATDVDHWKVPSAGNGRLVINLAGVGLDQPDLRLGIVDAAGQSVGASGRLQPDGTWTLVVAEPQAGQDYYLRVAVDPSSPVSVGNYVASAEFVESDTPYQLSSGDVSSSVDDFIRWTAEKSRLFRFDLFTQGASDDEAVQLTIYDAHTREVRLAIVANSGMTRTALAWLEQGDYIIRFSAVSHSGVAVNNVHYALEVHGLSDDQEPDGDNSQGDENHGPYDYDYYDYSYEWEDEPDPDVPYYVYYE